MICSPVSVRLIKSAQPVKMPETSGLHNPHRGVKGLSGFMSETQSEFVTCLCNTCQGKIEFERASFDPSTPPVVSCPHCGLETHLYIPQSVKIPRLPPPSPSPATSSLKDTIATPQPPIQWLAVSNGTKSPRSATNIWSRSGTSCRRRPPPRWSRRATP